MPPNRQRLQADLSRAIKARDELRVATLRMALAAVQNEQVAGKQVRELTEDEVGQVLAREAKKRRESAEAFRAGGRPELADRELAEERVLNEYLPPPLSDDELAALVAAAIERAQPEGPAAMGAVMRLVQPAVAGRAPGARVAAEVRRQLGG